MWENEEAKKPIGKRRPMPQPPADMLGLIAKGDADSIDAFNDAAFENYNKALEKCPNCPRTFNPESLPKHLKSCKGDG